MRSSRRFVLLAAIPAVLFARLSAADASLGESLVTGFVTEVTTLRARFEQSVLDAEGALVDASSGTIEIQRPGRFRWATDEPYEQQVIADGRNVWSYDVDLAQVTVKPQADALSNTPALLLGGDTDGVITWVRLVPRDDSSGFKRLVLGFAGDMLARMVFLDSLEQQTVVELRDVVYNASLDGALFEFTPPDDADIVGTPVTDEMP